MFFPEDKMEMNDVPKTKEKVYIFFKKNNKFLFLNMQKLVSNIGSARNGVISYSMRVGIKYFLPMHFFLLFILVLEVTQNEKPKRTLQPRN